MSDRIKLGVNIDHAATLRNARGENDPSILEFAFAVQSAGADTITMHLREDRRHIRDEDIYSIKEHIKIPINLEMALTNEMCEIALKLRPGSVCLVPEKREELTTEGGLNLELKKQEFQSFAAQCAQADIHLFAFIEPDPKNIQLAKDLGCAGIEAHTGKYARSFFQPAMRDVELKRLTDTAQACKNAGIQFNAGHGLNLQNIEPLLQIDNLIEVNIGHSLLSNALFHGIYETIAEMKKNLKRRQAY